jgi:NAD(P)-dependent dehydrogenase (short-subunit alcohol dehydrogenase family)
MGKLDGKVAVITGGGSGIGLATARRFVREGAQVVIAGRSQERLDAAVRDIGTGVEAHVADISNLDDLDALGAYVKAEHDRLDIVFANAAGERPGMFKDGLPTRFEDVSEDDFDFLSDVNFKGTFFTVQKLVPLMPVGGSVILTSSFLAARGRPGFAVYAATKAAIRSLVQSLTAELSDKGIRANAVAPGFIETDLLRSNGAGDALIEQAKAQSIAQIPQHRSGTVDDIASAVLFLASDDSAHVSGIELPVDGGWRQV